MLGLAQHRKEAGALDPPTRYHSREDRASALKPGAGGPQGQSKATANNNPQAKSPFLHQKAQNLQEAALERRCADHHFPLLQNGPGDARGARAGTPQSHRHASQLAQKLPVSGG